MTDDERKAKKAAYMRDYLRRNPDKAKREAARKRERRLNDPEWAERSRAKSREYADANKERNRERARLWQINNREKYLTRQRRLSKERSAMRVAKAMQWKKANPEKAKASAVDCSHRRRARKAGGDEQACRVVISGWRSKVRFVCALCGRRMLTKGNLQVDHILPLSKGGPHIPTNLQPVCKPCNLAKAARLDYTA